MVEPARNRFLDCLDREEFLLIEPLLRRVSIETDRTVVVQGAAITEVHFPLDAQFANVIRFPDGQAIETAVVGNEGMTGLAPFMADRPCAWEIVCRLSGEAYVASAQALRALVQDRPSILRRLLILTDLYQAQAAQAAACNAIHSVSDRIARWILTARDLSPYGALAFRQEELARLIGVQRSSVSEAASQLKQRGLIAYSRGSISVVDEAGLEAAACDCYRMLKPRLDAAHN